MVLTLVGTHTDSHNRGSNHRCNRETRSCSNRGRNGGSNNNNNEQYTYCSSTQYCGVVVKSSQGAVLVWLKTVAPNCGTVCMQDTHAGT